MNRIISYRGLLADGGQDTINLHTNDGKTGYKVVKFQLMPNEPGDGAGEHVVKAHTILQTTINGKIDFSDNTLLAAGHIANSATTYSNYSGWPSIIFDNMIFNQDIYISHEDSGGNAKINYYIELEQIDLTEDQALVAIVKNLRNEQ